MAMLDNNLIVNDAAVIVIECKKELGSGIPRIPYLFLIIYDAAVKYRNVFVVIFLSFFRFFEGYFLYSLDSIFKM